MKAFHDSRDCAYRAPYGAVEAGTQVTLALDIEDAQVERVELRTWVDGEGERLYVMTQASDSRYELVFEPKAPGIVWYHFIITAADGRQWRYGVPDGRRGGEGQLYDWEPPSFQLTVLDGSADARPSEAEEAAIGTSFKDVFAGFLCDEISAPEFAEAYETLRENCSHETFLKAVNLLGEPERIKLLAKLAGVVLDAEPVEDAHAYELIEGGRLGLAKGRLWCASLIQLLAAGLPSAEGETDNTGVTAEKAQSETSPKADAPAVEPVFGEDGAYDRVIAHWHAEDADCEAIVRNVVDLRFTLPLFDGESAIVAVNDDVIAFWCYGDDGSSVCVLVNSSLQHAYDVPVPMVNEGVSEIIAGYGIPVVDADEVHDVPTAFADAERYARVHLYQIGTAILYFHGSQRLERPMQSGLGVLAHITSLPSDAKAAADIAEHTADAATTTAPTPSRTGVSTRKLGTIGASARTFVDCLAKAGVRYWQILPVNPTDDHGSPYAGISAFAGNVRLLDAYPDFDAVEIDQDEYEAFCEREADWLDPYACFMAIRERVGAGKVWQKWPKKYLRYSKSVVERDAKLRASAEQWRRGQFVFEREWKSLRAYANERGVEIIGDMPIYVSADSSDVWAHREIFQLGPDGKPEVVAGCPPDAFAVDGQIWGNPLYDWDTVRDSGYAWWMRRLERAFDLYDVVRLDHFIGFARYFSIPDGEKATAGTYIPGPGLELFQAAFDKFGSLPVIAEDLGSITPCVRALVAACGFPGMDIVQFVDGGDPLAGYQPRPEKIAYTGTHDNQTLVGYCEVRYPDLDADEAAADLVEEVVTCTAPVRILPLQDVLGLDDEARMNEPGTVEGNWEWQADAADIERAYVRLRELARLSEKKRY